MPSPLVFTGFPKTGKTTVAKILCERYPDRFVEVDTIEYMKELIGSMIGVSGDLIDEWKQEPAEAFFAGLGCVHSRGLTDPTNRDVLGAFCKVVEERISPAAHTATAIAKLMKDGDKRDPIFTNVYHEETLDLIDRFYAGSEVPLVLFYTDQARNLTHCKVRDLDWVKGDHVSLWIRCDDLNFEAAADKIMRTLYRG